MFGKRLLMISIKTFSIAIVLVIALSILSWIGIFIGGLSGVIGIISSIWEN